MADFANYIDLLLESDNAILKGILKTPRREAPNVSGDAHHRLLKPPKF